MKEAFSFRPQAEFTIRSSKSAPRRHSQACSNRGQRCYKIRGGERNVHRGYFGVIHITSSIWKLRIVFLLPLFFSFSVFLKNFITSYLIIYDTETPVQPQPPPFRSSAICNPSYLTNHQNLFSPTVLSPSTIFCCSTVPPNPTTYLHTESCAGGDYRSAGESSTSRRPASPWSDHFGLLFPHSSSTSSLSLNRGWSSLWSCGHFRFWRRVVYHFPSSYPFSPPPTFFALVRRQFSAPPHCHWRPPTKLSDFHFPICPPACLCGGNGPIGRRFPPPSL